MCDVCKPRPDQAAGGGDQSPGRGYVFAEEVEEEEDDDEVDPAEMEHNTNLLTDVHPTAIRFCLE